MMMHAIESHRLVPVNDDRCHLQYKIPIVLSKYDCSYDHHESRQAGVRLLSGWKEMKKKVSVSTSVFVVAEIKTWKDDGGERLMLLLLLWKMMRTCAEHLPDDTYWLRRLLLLLTFGLAARSIPTTEEPMTL